MFRIQSSDKVVRWLRPNEVDVIQKSTVYEGYNSLKLVTARIKDPITNPSRFLLDVVSINFGHLFFLPFIYICIRLPEALCKYLAGIFVSPYLAITGQYDALRKIILGNLFLLVNAVALSVFLIASCLLFDVITIPARIFQTLRHIFLAHENPESLHYTHQPILEQNSPDGPDIKVQHKPLVTPEHIETADDIEILTISSDELASTSSSLNKVN